MRIVKIQQDTGVKVEKLSGVLYVTPKCKTACQLGVAPLKRTATQRTPPLPPGSVLSSRQGHAADRFVCNWVS